MSSGQYKIMGRNRLGSMIARNLIAFDNERDCVHFHCDYGWSNSCEPSIRSCLFSSIVRVLKPIY